MRKYAVAEGMKKEDEGVTDAEMDEDDKVERNVEEEEEGEEREEEEAGTTEDREV